MLKYLHKKNRPFCVLRSADIFRVQSRKKVDMQQKAPMLAHQGFKAFVLYIYY